jgi:hypothetical protein
VNGSSGGTPITAEELNRLEAGIESIDDRVTALEEVGVSVQSASYTLALGDAGKSVEITSAVPTNVTVPTNAGVAFPIGTIIEIVQMGAGQVALAPAVGATLRSPNGLKLRAQYSSASIRKRASDEWVVAGDTIP